MGQIYQQLTSISLCKQYFLSKEEGHLLLSWPALAPSRHFITCQAWYCAGTSQTLSPSARNRIPFVTSKCDLANWRFPKMGIPPNHFNMIFQYKPSIWGYRSWNPPMLRRHVIHPRHTMVSHVCHVHGAVVQSPNATWNRGIVAGLSDILAFAANDINHRQNLQA